MTQTSRLFTGGNFIFGLIPGGPNFAEIRVRGGGGRLEDVPRNPSPPRGHSREHERHSGKVGQRVRAYSGAVSGAGALCLGKASGNESGKSSGEAGKKAGKLGLSRRKTAQAGQKKNAGKSRIQRAEERAYNGENSGGRPGKRPSGGAKVGQKGRMGREKAEKKPWHGGRTAKTQRETGAILRRRVKGFRQHRAELTRVCSCRRRVFRRKRGFQAGLLREKAGNRGRKGVRKELFARL